MCTLIMLSALFWNAGCRNDSKIPHSFICLFMFETKHIHSFNLFIYLFIYSFIVEKRLRGVQPQTFSNVVSLIEVG